MGRGQVLAAYLEEEPLISDWPSLVSFPYIVVVRSSSPTVFIAMKTSRRFWASIGAASTQEILRRNPYVLQGHILYYGRAIGADPMMAEIILDIACRFDRQYPCIESK